MPYLGQVFLLDLRTFGKIKGDADDVEVAAEQCWHERADHAGAQLDAQARIDRLELRNDGSEVLVAPHQPGANADGAGGSALQRLDLADCIADLALDESRAARKDLAVWSRLHPLGPALEQRHADAILELLDALGERGLRDVHHLGGARDRDVVHDRQEVADQLWLQLPDQLQLPGLRLVHVVRPDAGTWQRVRGDMLCPRSREIHNRQECPPSPYALASVAARDR